MSTSFSRARLLGAALAIGMFALGAAVGWLVHGSPRQEGTRVMITATDAIPKELEVMSLTPVQRDSVRSAIRRGRNRVLNVVDKFEPQMRAALDSADGEIRAILDSRQRITFDSLRHANAPTTQRRFIRPDSN